MSGHFEYSHDPEYPEDLPDLLHRLELVHQGGEVVGQDGQQVNDVHEALDELAVVRAGEEPHQELHGEPGHVDRLQDINECIRVWKTCSVSLDIILLGPA